MTARATTADPGARLRERAERARQKLWAAAVRGDPEARRALRDLGEEVPPPRPWCDVGEDDEEGS